MPTNLRVDAARLWKSLMEMARIGATEKGGVCRLALSDEDKRARDLFVDWCQAAGCTIRIDKMGNIFARRAGRDNTLSAVLTGSHIDSQPTGGKFDGVYGVLCGLEIIRTLNDADFRTLRPIEAVIWTNEEGSRFAPAMVASGVFAGVFDLEYGLSRRDLTGRSMAEELKRIGYDGAEEVGGREIHAFFEAHIEQGPILEAERKRIGIVTGAQGQRWFEVTLRGQEAHAGPTPMITRRDALVGCAQVIGAVNRIGRQFQPHACATVGLIDCRPNSRNTIPGEVFFTVDLRHPDDAKLLRMAEEIRIACNEAAADNRLSLDFNEIWYVAPVRFDASCVHAVERGANDLGFSMMPIISGAGHDACYLSRVAPTGMVFIPCENGISHNEVEHASPADCTAGCDVLMRAILQRAEEH